MGKKVKMKAEKKPKVEEGALMLRHRTIIPDIKICATNCLNWDAFQRCPIFMKGRICSSWRPRDLGDGDELGEEVPYTWETALGSAKPKQGKHAIEAPKEEADAAGDGEEEVEEVV